MQVAKSDVRNFEYFVKHVWAEAAEAVAAAAVSVDVHLNILSADPELRTWLYDFAHGALSNYRGISCHHVENIVYRFTSRKPDATQYHIFTAAQYVIAYTEHIARLVTGRTDFVFLVY